MEGYFDIPLKAKFKKKEELSSLTLNFIASQDESFLKTHSELCFLYYYPKYPWGFLEAEKTLISEVSVRNRISAAALPYLKIGVPLQVNGLRNLYFNVHDFNTETGSQLAERARLHTSKYEFLADEDIIEELSERGLSTSKDWINATLTPELCGLRIYYNKYEDKFVGGVTDGFPWEFPSSALYKSREAFISNATKFLGNGFAFDFLWSTTCIYIE